MPALNETRIAEIIEDTKEPAQGKASERERKKEPKLRANVDPAPEESPS